MNKKNKQPMEILKRHEVEKTFAQARNKHENRAYYIVNSITFYRLVAAPFMVWIIFTGNMFLFSILLPISFFTDLIDGPLARKYKVTSVFGSRLDSIGDDLTILAGIIGIFIFKRNFIHDHKVIVSVMIALLVIQNVAALLKFRKVTSFHTYLAKIAAVFQGTFLILLFLLAEPVSPLFYIAAALTILDLVEEIVLVIFLNEWKSDLKGLYWVFKQQQSNSALAPSERRTESTNKI